MFALAFVLGTSAFAATTSTVTVSDNALDMGIVVGATSSKKFTVKTPAFTYVIIGADLGEPACNSVQAVIWVQDGEIAGDAGGAAYNLGLQFSGILSAKAQGHKVVLKVRRNNPEDCTKNTIETYTFSYTSANGDAGSLTLTKM